MPSPANLFASLLFGLIGLAAFRYGKKSAQTYPIAIGIVLMVYPYFISRTWLLYLLGCALCAALFLLRE